MNELLSVLRVESSKFCDRAAAGVNSSLYRNVVNSVFAEFGRGLPKLVLRLGC